MKNYNLTQQAKEWFVAMFEQLAENDEKMTAKIEFDLKEFVRFVIHYIYDYQAKRQWSHISQITAKITGYEERQMRRLAKK